MNCHACSSPLTKPTHIFTRPYLLYTCIYSKGRLIMGDVVMIYFKIWKLLRTPSTISGLFSCRLWWNIPVDFQVLVVHSFEIYSGDLKEGVLRKSAFFSWWIKLSLSTNLFERCCFIFAKFTGSKQFVNDYLVIPYFIYNSIGKSFQNVLP